MFESPCRYPNGGCIYVVDANGRRSKCKHWPRFSMLDLTICQQYKVKLRRKSRSEENGEDGIRYERIGKKAEEELKEEKGRKEGGRGRLESLMRKDRKERNEGGKTRR